MIVNLMELLKVSHTFVLLPIKFVHLSDPLLPPLLLELANLLRTELFPLLGCDCRTALKVLHKVGQSEQQKSGFIEQNRR